MLCKVIFISFILQKVLLISVILKIQPLETQCFYERLESESKYKISLVPLTQSTYDFAHQLVHKYSKTIVSKQIVNSRQHINIDKFATMTGMYSFCIDNKKQQLLQIQFTFLSGLSLMEFDVLPQMKDNELLEKQIKYLFEQQKNLFKSLNSIENTKVNTQNLFNVMSEKILLFGILSCIVIILVNFAFYKQFIRMLKQRKRI